MIYLIIGLPRPIMTDRKEVPWQTNPRDAHE